MWAEGVMGYPASVVLEELVSAFRHDLLDPRLTLSMELYCSALLESSERARFITVVSALEPLAEQASLGDGVDVFVDSALNSLSATPDIEPNLRASLRGRVEQLRRESVRQALLRLTSTWFPGRTDIRRQIDEAYGLRSELLHDGTLSDPDCGLSAKVNTIANILRSIYAKASGRPFRTPVQV